jgi:hypothetical protein
MKIDWVRESDLNPFIREGGRAGGGKRKFLLSWDSEEGKVIRRII